MKREKAGTKRRVQSKGVSRKKWPIGLAGLVAMGAALAALAVSAALHFWTVRRPPKPPGARLPSSARMLLQPFRKDGLDLTLPANGEVAYRIAMQAGATLVYSWTASHGVSCRFANQEPVLGGAGRGAFVAQSSGWYRWRWNNPTGGSVGIHLKLSGYYEPSSLPPGGLPYDR